MMCREKEKKTRLKDGAVLDKHKGVGKNVHLWLPWDYFLVDFAAAGAAAAAAAASFANTTAG